MKIFERKFLPHFYISRGIIQLIQKLSGGGLFKNEYYSILPKAEHLVLCSFIIQNSNYKLVTWRVKNPRAVFQGWR